MNLRGQLENLHLIPRVTLPLRNNSDIVCFTETGHLPNNSTLSHTALPGFACIYSEPRPYDSEHGGVAVYARANLVPHLRVGRKAPRFGMVWVTLTNPLGGRDICMCVLYLPHQTSPYYNREDKSLNFDAHISEIQSCIAAYAPLNHILLLGDLNARMGSLDDRPAWDLGEWSPEGALLEPPDAHITRSAPPRVSSDRIDNAQGRSILELMIACNLIMANGRVPGDEKGSMTFFGPNDASSLIDYFIGTPSLLLSPSGSPLPGLHLAVPSRDQRLRLPGNRPDSFFDHVPLTLSLPPATTHS